MSTSWITLGSTTTYKLKIYEDYNLGQNKVRNEITPPAESMMNPRKNQNAPLFSTLKWGEGWSYYFI